MWGQCRRTGLWARAKGIRYIPFEPEALEARCCDLNNFAGNPETRREALWKENTTLTFYSKPDSADSSAIDPGGSIATEVEGITLDNAVSLAEISGTVILKIDAEGAEPEVLEGATKTLPLIDWVSVDCSGERGVTKETTFTETDALLRTHGFRPFKSLSGGLKMTTVLYRNTR